MAEAREAAHLPAEKRELVPDQITASKFPNGNRRTVRKTGKIRRGAESVVLRKLRGVDE
jgi:hypothetical protein